MKFTDLEPLQVFTLDGKSYECIELYPAAVQPPATNWMTKGNYVPTGNADNPYKIRLVSDIRFNEQNDI